MQKLRLLDLFSGIGGFSLGLEATQGFETFAFVETNPFCQRVLRKHWPHVQQFSDIREVTIQPGAFDALCGGFPCQDVSAAKSTGGGQSLLGDRSGLWFEYLRLIEEGHPNWIIIENVKVLRTKGLSIILEQLAKLGYDAEWHIIPAYGAGYPHARERLWVVAHATSHRLERVQPFPLQGLRSVPWAENGRIAENWLGRWDPSAPRLLRSRNGVPNYVDRITAIGNAVVPAIAYYIGSAILRAEGWPEVA